MKDKMVVMAQWLEKFWAQCDEKQKKEICYGIINYGVFGETYESNDGVTNIALNFIIPQIQLMQEGYNEMVKHSRKAGRKANPMNLTIWKMAREGKAASVIADALSISAKTIYSSEGWRERNNAFYDSEIPKIDSQNSENSQEIPKINSQNSLFDF